MTRIMILALAGALAACAGEPSTAERFLHTLREGGADPGELWLSQTGLYADAATGTIGDDRLMSFEPRFPLWSDGAEKRRWLRLPPGSRIDNGDPDHWSFPVGTLAFKEFSLAGRRIETRVIARLAPDEYWMGAFLWNEAQTDARHVPEGARDALGSEHDVPSATQCGTCHNGEPGKLLGFSQLQQPNVSPELMRVPIPSHVALPGEPLEQSALGYLHANCAHCHNPRGSARPDTDMDLRLSAGARRLDDAGAYRSAVGRRVQSTLGPLRDRIAPGHPEASAVLQRMRSTDPRMRMPPLGTERVDAEGLAAVRAWIAGLPTTQTTSGH